MAAFTTERAVGAIEREACREVIEAARRNLLRVGRRGANEQHKREH